MGISEPAGLLKKRKLTEMEIQDIEQLADICNHFENLYLRAFRNILQNRPGQEINDFLYYQHGRLVGCLCLDNWKLEESEVIVGAVHPDYRRRSIGRALLNAAQQECASRGVQRIILVSEPISSAGRAFAEAVGACYDSSEYHMQLHQLQEGNRFDERLYVRLATMDDLDSLVTIQAACFDRPVARVRTSVLERLRQRDLFYLATFGESDLGCEEPVGVLRVEETPEQFGIYGVGVLPDYQGRGYGRQMLEEVVRGLRSRSQQMITLEVDVSNARALGLYRSCGFQIRTTYDYFVKEL